MRSSHRILAVGLLVLITSRAEAQTTPAKDKEASRPPQVRTYSTVTVVDDPAKAPRLPTQKSGPSTPTPRPPETKEPARPVTPAQAREGLGPTPTAEVREGKPVQPTPPIVREHRNLDAVRQDLRATAKELREASKREPIRDTAAPVSPAQNQPLQKSNNRPRLQVDKMPRPILRDHTAREN